MAIGDNLDPQVGAGMVFTITLPGGRLISIFVPGGDASTAQTQLREKFPDAIAIGRNVTLEGIPDADTRFPRLISGQFRASRDGSRTQFDLVSDEFVRSGSGATGSDDGFGQFTNIGQTTDTGEAARRAALLANTQGIDPALAGSLNERQRLGGLFRNFATDQGLNPTGLASSAVSQRFNPAFAAQTIGQQLAGQGFQSGLAPGAVNQDFRGFLDASGGFGNIDQTAGNVFTQLLNQSDPNLQNQQFLNPTVLEAGGGFTNDARFILDLARQASRNRLGGAASFFGTPSEAELNTRFQTAPQANFAQFAADALGAG